MKAFTLVELLVSISIIAILAAMSISAYPKFSEQIALTGETYKILAYLKETQSYGVAAMAAPGKKFVYAYVLDKSSTTIKRVIIETPTSVTNQYYINSSVDDTVAERFTIKDVFEIYQINGILNNSTTSLDKAYGFFKRPNPESRVIGQINTNISPDTDTGSYPKLEVVLRSKKNNAFVKKIVILQTGQMYVSDW